MKLDSYFVLANLIHFGFCGDCVLQRPQEVLVERRIQTDLLCGYRSEDPPNSNGTNGLEVKINYLLLGMSVDEETLTLYTRSIFKWEDDRLKWDIDKYEGQEFIFLNTYNIWSPDVQLKNGIGSDFHRFDISKCKVKYTGHVKCHSAEVSEHSTLCSSSLTNWPYDKKNCLFKFDDAAWSQTKSNFTFSEFSVILYSELKTVGWQAHTGRVLENFTGDFQATFELITQRPSKALEAMILTPIFILPLLTVSSMLLDVRDNKRLGILCLSLVSHFELYDEFGELIPKFGADTPVIVLFLSKSTLLTLIVIALTFISRYFVTITMSPPRFVTFCNSIIFNSRAKDFIIPSWNDVNIEKYYTDSITWINFINIVNSVSLFVNVLVYTILFLMYTPENVRGVYLQNAV